MSSISFRWLAVALCLCSVVIFLGNSGGAAASGNFFTGAPSTGGGTEGTCNTCHRGGSFGEPAINVSFAVGDSTVNISEYVPGQTYRVTVALGYDNEPSGYGFSSQFLTTGTTPIVNAGTPGNPAADVRITQGGNGRTYVEQSRRGQDSLFTFDWTAPQAGTGTVTYYVSGNLINNAAGTGGDNGSSSPTVITLNEGAPLSTRYFSSIPHALFPNPTFGAATLRVTPPVAGEYELKLMSIDGRFVRTRMHQLGAQSATVEVPSLDLPAGIYAVSLTGQGSRLTSRLVVR